MSLKEAGKRSTCVKQLLVPKVNLQAIRIHNAARIHCAAPEHIIQTQPIVLLIVIDTTHELTYQSLHVSARRVILCLLQS